MDFTEMFKLQQDWQNKARIALTATTASVAIPSAPSDNKQKRIDEITSQIAALTAQKTAKSVQFDAAIAACADQLTRLQAELPQDKKLIQDVANAIASPPNNPDAAEPSKEVGKEAPPKQAAAARLPSKDVAAATPTRKASTKTTSEKARTKARSRK